MRRHPATEPGELRSGLGATPRYRSWFAARIWIEPMAALSIGGATPASEAGACLELRLAFPARGGGSASDGDAHAHALLVRAQMLRTTLTFTGAPVATTGWLNLGFDLR